VYAKRDHGPLAGAGPPYPSLLALFSQLLTSGINLCYLFLSHIISHFKAPDIRYESIAEIQKGLKMRRKPGSKASLDKALRRATISPTVLYRLGLLDVGLAGVYEACHRGEIKSFRRGRKILIPTAPLRKKLGIETV
jgi:hypothetical protein